VGEPFVADGRASKERRFFVDLYFGPKVPGQGIELGTYEREWTV